MSLLPFFLLQTGAGASKEANKNVAKDSDASVGTRAQAAGDAIGDKKDEMSHNAKGEAYESKARN